LIYIPIFENVPGPYASLCLKLKWVYIFDTYISIARVYLITGVRGLYLKILPLNYKLRIYTLVNSVCITLKLETVIGTFTKEDKGKE
jgi:hypothetical protein